MKMYLQVNSWAVIGTILGYIIWFGNDWFVSGNNFYFIFAVFTLFVTLNIGLTLGLYLNRKNIG